MSGLAACKTDSDCTKVVADSCCASIELVSLGTPKDAEAIIF